MMIKIITVTDIAYTSGQGGTPIYADDFTMVENAAVINVPQTEDKLALTVNVVDVGLACGSIVNTSGTIPPVGNEILIFAGQSYAGTIVELSTSTIASLTLLVEGN